MRKDGDLLASRVAASMILVSFIPYFLTGFVAFAFLRYIFSKLCIDNADAIGKEFNSDQTLFD